MAKLEEELRQLLEDKNKKPEAPESLGGCCGKSSGGKKAGDEGDKDPNVELDKLATEVIQAQQSGKGNVNELRGTLEAKYEQNKEKGVQLKPEVEAKVQQALGGGTGGKKPEKPDDKKKATPAAASSASKPAAAKKT